MGDKAKVNPSLQEILDKDVALHNYLLELAHTGGQSSTDMILAVGLSAIHERLGEMWRWDKAVDPS